MATVQITIPDALGKDAAAEGLLEPGSIEAILRERLGLNLEVGPRQHGHAADAARVTGAA